MNGSDRFKERIEDFLNEKSLSDTAFAPMLSKASKNVQDCLKYIIAEVRKTGLCAFDDSEIFEMALRYYTDDTIGIPPDIKCRVIAEKPKEADLFSAPPPETASPAKETSKAEIHVVAPAVTQPSKPAQTTLTLFDL